MIVESNVIAAASALHPELPERDCDEQSRAAGSLNALSAPPSEIPESAGTSDSDGVIGAAGITSLRLVSECANVQEQEQEEKQEQKDQEQEEQTTGADASHGG